MKQLSLCLLIFVLLLAACSPGSASSGSAVTITLDVALTPALQPLADALRACTAQQPSMVLVVHERLAPDLFNAPADLYIHLGEPDPPSDFAAQIAWEQVILIAHPSTDITSWDLPFIRTLFTAIHPVDSPANANVWLPLAGDETLAAFQDAVLVGSRLSPEIHLAPNPAAMLAAVSGDPAAVGILPAAWLDDSVRSFDLGIQLPVLLTAPQPPTGPALDLAACLQGPVGQTILAERYQPWDVSAVETGAP